MAERIVYSGNHVLHNPPFEIYDGTKEPYAEKPERLEAIVQALRENGVVDLSSPKKFSVENVLRVHHPEYEDFLKKRSESLSEGEVLYPSYFIMDTYTPIVKGTYDAAKSSVDVALTGAEYLLEGGKTAYALCRPPGHHAEQKAMSGYCYFNNAAIAADFLSKEGKVAILDVDFHHGNGTQSAFYERSDVLYTSIHADPHVKFPYISGFSDEKGKAEGLGYNRNSPLPLGTTDEQYFEALLRELDAVKKFDPKFLVVSLGFDTYEKDPIGGFSLSIPFYEKMGRQIKDLKLSTLLVQEGGYNIDDLGKMAVSFLSGIA